MVCPLPEYPRAGTATRFVKSIAPLVFVLAVCALTGTAAGHAMLQRTEPRVESRVKRSPDEVKLYFTEPVEPAYSSVRVVNDRGGQVDRGDSRVDRSNPVLLPRDTPGASSRNVTG